MPDQSPVGTDAAIPAVHVEPTGFSVSPIPYGSIDHISWAITVERRGVDTWAVCRPRRCMNAAGEWSWESLPSSREDDWLAEHRFDLATALDLAKRHAPDVRVNGMTAQEVADV